jgi:hypothetical protein
MVVGLLKEFEELAEISMEKNNLTDAICASLTNSQASTIPGITTDSDWCTRI